MFYTRFKICLRAKDGTEHEAGYVTLETEGEGEATDAQAMASVRGELEYDEALRVYVFRGEMIPSAQFGGLSITPDATWTDPPAA